MTCRQPLLLSALFALAACSPPKRDYSIDQIQQTDDLEELMDVQATVADHLMKRARRLTPDEMTDELFAQYVDMGVRLKATSRKLPAFKPGEGWKRFAAQLQRQAGDLANHASAKDGGGTLQTAMDINETCAACHDEYR